jgi:hypothetical protein
MGPGVARRPAGGKRLDGRDGAALTGQTIQRLLRTFVLEREGADMADNKDWTKTDIGKKPDVLIAFAGYKLKLESSQKWAAALAAAIPSKTSKNGVGTAFAVRGPNKTGDTLDAQSLADALDPVFTGDASTRIFMVTHSSGYSFTNQLFRLLIKTKSKDKAYAQRLVYYNLDGGDDDLAGVKSNAWLFSEAYAVSGHLDRPKDSAVPSRNYGDMQLVDGKKNKHLGGFFQQNGLGTFVDLDWRKIMGGDADKWPPDPNILHMALINPSKPLWYPPSKDDKQFDAKMAVVKKYPSFYGGDLNPTYATCTKSNVTADYFQ